MLLKKFQQKLLPSTFYSLEFPTCEKHEKNKKDKNERRWHPVIATKSSPAAALDPLPAAEPAILSIILTTEPMSPTDALSALGDRDFTWEKNYSITISFTKKFLSFSETSKIRVGWSETKKRASLTALIKHSSGCSVTFDLPETVVKAPPWAPSGLVNSASKGDADIPGVPIARDGASACATDGWCTIFPVFKSEEISETGLSESPGIGDGACWCNCCCCICWFCIKFWRCCNRLSYCVCSICCSCCCCCCFRCWCWIILEFDWRGIFGCSILAPLCADNVLTLVGWEMLTRFCCTDPTGVCCNELSAFPCPESKLEPGCIGFIMFDCDVESPDKVER